MLASVLSPVRQFVHCPTPASWLAEAPNQPAILLIDHANCELKAAQAAVRLLRRYSGDETDWLAAMAPCEDVAYGRCSVRRFLANVERYRLPQPGKRSALIDKLYLLVREELHHFRQVLEIMQRRGVAYDALPAGQYARDLRRACRTHEPACLVDQLIIGAYIEARSCERFAALIPLVDAELGQFYRSLLRSEARHFEDYLALAQGLSSEPVTERIRLIGQVEARLIERLDPLYRFHSGQPH
ncbi:tRNA-(ms[2]io[6]A)-hydroxylase [Ferrimonas pelagia]|uniref:tRNA isopentenyl-2-thiomethyl-A-37 hydroxylase MiaE n=1 Tax=Ferrimonas pelagia TaxID=1177826 RepID=A0ABP9E8G3_9GAMM